MVSFIFEKMWQVIRHVDEAETKNKTFQRTEGGDECRKKRKSKTMQERQNDDVLKQKYKPDEAIKHTGSQCFEENARKSGFKLKP